MPSARGIRAGAAYVELYAQDNRLVRGLKRAQRRLARFGVGVRKAGLGLLKLSAVMATPFALGAKVYADFEQQMANVTTMLSEPEVHMGRFRQGIREMSVEFGESTEALAGGLYDILSASIPAEKAMNVLAVAARAAKAGLTDTKTSADAITTILNAYGLSAERAADVSDVLFMTVRRGKTTFAELAPSIGLVVSTAASAGVGFEELSASLAVLTRNGVRTENAVTAVNAIIATFLKPSAEAAAYAQKLGFEMSTATLQAEGLEGVFRKIAHLPPDAIAKLFPNKRAIRGVIPALKNIESFREDVAAMRTAGGSTETAYRKMTATLMHSFNQLKQSALVAFSVIGEALAGPLSRAAKTIREYAGYITNLIQRNKGLVVAAAKVVAVIAAIGGVLVVVGAAGGALAVVFGGIASIISGVGTVVGILGAAIGALLTPMGLVITAAVALAGYLIYASGAGAKALSWLGKRFEALRDVALSAWQGISDALAAGDIALAARVLWLTLRVQWQKGIAWLKEKWLSFKDFFVSVGTDAFYGLVTVMANTWADLERLWVEATSFLSRSWTSFTSTVMDAWEAAVGFVAKQLLKLQGKFDKSLDVELATKFVEEDTRKARADIEAKRKQQLAETEGTRTRRLTLIEKQRAGTLTEIDREAKAAHERRRKEYATELARSEEALAKARKEWREAIDQAAGKRAAKEKEKGEEPEPLSGVGKTIADLKARLGNVSQNVQTAVNRTVEVRGSFNAEAVRALVAGGMEDRIAKATEDTATNTKRLVEKAEEGLAFG